MSLLEKFDPAFGNDWLTALLPPPYPTHREVGAAIDRAWENRNITRKP